MPSFVGQPLDGDYSGQKRQLAPLAPEDRAPQFVHIPASKIPAPTANGYVVEFPKWVRWLQVEDDGGEPLLLTDLATAKVSVVSSGSFVWLGNRKLKLNYQSAAPTSTVKIYGLSQEDALVLASATAINITTAAPVNPTKQNSFSELALAFVTYSVPTYTYTRSAAQGVAGGSYRVQSAPVIQSGQAPGNYNEADSVIVIGGSTVGPLSGGGIRLFPGGDVEVDGVFYAIEIGHIDTNTEASPTSFLEIQRIG